MPDDANDYVIFRKKRPDRFPLGVTNPRAQVFENDPTLEENRRRLHGTDPLQDGFDAGENPIIVRRPHPREKIPIR